MDITHVQLLKTAKQIFSKKILLNPTDQKQITAEILTGH